MQNLNQILKNIDDVTPKHFQKLIGIDGLGGSGKSAISQRIKEFHQATSIISVDEFYKPLAERTEGVLADTAVSPDFDWDRLEGHVIDAIRRNALVKYRRYQWREDIWGPWIEAPAENWIIIEGIYALQSRFFGAYDYTVWMEATRGERIKQMTNREGESVALEWQEKWLPREERYFELERPDKRAVSTIFANTSE